MKLVSSITTFLAPEGMRMIIAYSDVDSDGKIIKQNVRVNRIVFDEDALTSINAVKAYAQQIIDGEE